MAREGRSMSVPIPTRIFRIIHVENLPLLLARGGLHAPLHLPGDAMGYRSIHNPDIQRKRRTRSIPCGPGGVLQDYVPFFLGPRPPMLLQLKTGQVEGYTEGQNPLIYLVSTAQVIAASGTGFVFSDGQGIARITRWFVDLQDLAKVDWTAVHATYWQDRPDDMDRQRRKQAEFLVHRFLRWDLIDEIGVNGKQTAVRVEALLSTATSKSRCEIRVRPEWYYL
jgi:hypothetical protein